MKVLFIHAYSPRNTGDGLLVDLSRAIAREAFGPHRFAVVALDAAAFAPEYNAHRWGFASGRWSGVVPRSLDILGTLLLGPSREIRHLFDEADVILAVGGGYLRARSLTEAVRFAGAHLGQLRLAARHGRKTVYLPQSIGPFVRPLQAVVNHLLGRVAAVFVRDDRTFGRLAMLPGTQRLPDLAVLAAGQPQANRSSGPRAALVARALPRPRGYVALLHAISRATDARVVIQSAGLGNDDRRFSLEVFGPGASDALLADVLDAKEVGVVISSRLHGSMAAILAGTPSIHLSYESKGWGAFEDLGIPDHVFNARSADPADVIAAYRALAKDGTDYWRRVAAAGERLRRCRSDLVRALRLLLESDESGAAS